jgi:hypothetical protein
MESVHQKMLQVLSSSETGDKTFWCKDEKAKSTAHVDILPYPRLSSGNYPNLLLQCRPISFVALSFWLDKITQKQHRTVRTPRAHTEE